MGALVSPLIALALLSKFGHNLRFVFYLAVIPSAIGIILLLYLSRTYESDKIIRMPLPFGCEIWS